MKQETLLKFKELLDQQRMEFSGNEVRFDLTDEELSKLVQLEYGQTQQNVVELFTVLCKKLVKLAEKENVPEV